MGGRWKGRRRRGGGVEGLEGEEEAGREREGRERTRQEERKKRHEFGQSGSGGGGGSAKGRLPRCSAERTQKTKHNNNPPGFIGFIFRNGAEQKRCAWGWAVCFDLFPLVLAKGGLCLSV